MTKKKNTKEKTPAEVVYEGLTVEQRLDDIERAISVLFQDVHNIDITNVIAIASLHQAGLLKPVEEKSVEDFKAGELNKLIEDSKEQLNKLYQVNGEEVSA